MGLGRFLKAKYRKLKLIKKLESYEKVDPTASMRVEARSRLAQKIISETLKAAESPGRVKSLSI